MPWGTWITCEETVNGPDVGPDFTGASNVPLQRRHGFIYEVPAGGQSNRQPITSAGRFAHEGAAWNPKERALYLTEDNFAFPSGFYRYLPPSDPMKTGSLANGGRLQMLRVVGQTNAHLEANQANGATYKVDWVDIADPNPTFPNAGDDDHEQRHSSTSATRDGHRAPRTSRAWRARRSRRTGSTSRRRRAADPPRRVPSSSCGYGKGSRPGLGVRPEGQDARVRLPVAERGCARAPRQRHPQQQGHDRHLRGRPCRQLRPRADRSRARSSTSP